jgi:hypothetical protein
VSILLPVGDGRLQRFELNTKPVRAAPAKPPTSRIAFAAAHVVADPLGDNAPGTPAVIDWDHTLGFRRYLWSLGLSVAEAMDTAQRGMGLDWSATQELIRRSAVEARSLAGGIAVGAGTDQLAPGNHSLAAVSEAYEQQVALVEQYDAQPILMASRALCASASGPDDYLKVYGELLRQVSRPVILHWLGAMFDPALTGYWGSTDLDAAADIVVELIREHGGKVDGIKVSLLDTGREVALRNRLPEGVRLYTGDDLHYPGLIKSGSHALLGVFAAIAPAASVALHALDADDEATYDSVLEATVPLARQIFAPPTYYYKTGIAFLAWLNGHQPAFTMVGGLQSGRSLLHLAETLRLADAAGVLTDPPLAETRFRTLLAIHGIDS